MVGLITLYILLAQAAGPWGCEEVWFRWLESWFRPPQELIDWPSQYRVNSRRVGIYAENVYLER